MTWDEFFNAYNDTKDDKILKQYVFLDGFGPSNEVLEIAFAFEDIDKRKNFLLIAHKQGVDYSPEDYKVLNELINDEKIIDYFLISSKRLFSKEDLDKILYFASKEAVQTVAERNNISYYAVNPFFNHVDVIPKAGTSNVKEIKNSSGKLWGIIVGTVAFLGTIFFGAIFKNASDMNQPRRCNGNCAECPPHFGYRYGRWYYGHDHVGGCEFGGNRGSGSMD